MVFKLFDLLINFQLYFFELFLDDFDYFIFGDAWRQVFYDFNWRFNRVITLSGILIFHLEALSS